MIQSFALLESILWERQSGYWLLDRHLARLQASCDALGFPYDQSLVQEVLEDCVDVADGEHFKTRFEFHKDGSVHSNLEAIEPISPKTIWKIAIAPQRLNKADPLIYHKTTKRDFYSQALQWGKDNHAVNEVLLLNEDEQFCEGSYCNLFVERDDILLTPPVSNGLLAGTFRGQLIEEGKAVEADISLEMLQELPIFMGNSVRGLIRAELI
jgi:branched-subunit amino acid aminotransferase/4-amino-4-deoxychorismate lyase